MMAVLSYYDTNMIDDYIGITTHIIVEYYTSEVPRY